MRKLFTLLLALFCFTGVWAEDVTEEQALEQALDFLSNQTTASGRPRHTQGTTPQLTLASKVNDLYVFNVKDNGGFVIVSNDDRTIPVLGFSENGKFDENNMPDNMKAWLQGYADEIAWLKKHNTTTTGPKKVRSKVGSHSTEAVAPLCTSTWYQDAPYNNLCPNYNSWSGSGKSATGCVATAMAQVMYYHKWPETTTKVIPGYTTYSYSMNLSSLPVTTFDWANMIDDYSGSYTNTQGTAVATLMKYCGYSVQMDYGPESGAYTEDVATALINYFDYNANTTQFVNRSSYTYANWTDLIYHEVANNRPVVYGGLSTGGGHEFVCDGYKYQSGTDFFHINWGWGGLSDNYFVLSALDPDQQGIGGSSSTDGFHYGQDAVIGIQKSTDSGTIANISPNVINLALNSITFSSNPSEPGAEVNIIFNVTNNSSDDYDGDLWLYLNYDGEFYPIDLVSVVIPAGETQECIIPYTPEVADTYEFAFGYINAKGEYVVYDNMTATLTVAERTKNEYVPVYGYYCDELSRSQFIIPAANIENMLNSYINGMTFYAAQTSVNWGAAQFDVYLSEVNSTTINSLKDWDSLDKVYAGSLSISEGKMVINFDASYYYQGGNLLVGVNQTVKGSYVRSNWYGETVTGASLGGYNTSVSQQNFLPEVTFDYTPGEAPTLAKPKNVTISYTGGTEATVSWTSDATAFDIDVNGTVTEDVSNPCTLTGLELATTYNIKVRAKKGGEVSDWTTPVSFTTDLSDDMCQIRLVLTDSYGDGWNGAYIKIVDVLTGTEIGTYANQNLNGTQGNGEDEVNTITVDVPNNRDIQFQWIKGQYDSECSYVVYNVNDEVIFSGTGAMSSAFTYHVDCNAVKKPTNLAVTEIGSTNATISWEGTADSYNLKYRETGGTLVTDFEDSSMGGWTTIDADGDGYTWVLGSACGSIYLEEGGSLTGSGHNNSQDLVTSGSYTNVTKAALTPDNYLVSPMVKLGGSITFYACGQDESYASETFGVAVSTTSNTDPSAFTTIAKWEMNANGTGTPKSSRRRAQGTWGEFTVDLSAYAGQKGYVAIRHFDCTDMFMLNIDDITIVQPGEAGEKPWIIVNNIEATSYELTDLTPDTNYEVQVQAVNGEYTSNWVGTFFCTEEANIIEFANDADNTELINGLDGQTCDVQLTGRTLYKDGTWNTLCLPFDVTIEGSPLEGADVRTLSNVTLEGETVTLNFTAEGAVTTLTAGTPYIIKWEADDNIVNPIFNGVTINKTLNDETFTLGEEESITFKGTYTKTTYTEENKSILFVGADNKLNYPLAGATIGAFRGYFTLAGLTVSEANGVKFFTNLGDDDDPTAIANINAKDSGDWYDLNGRKLAGKPSMKGIYVNGGRKVTVK